MEIKTLEISGLPVSLASLRLPFGKFSPEDANPDININDVDEARMALAERLVKAGDSHAKALRGIIVYTLIKAPIYWWRELETYRCGHERLSCESTMHIDCRGIEGEQLQKSKAEIPMGHEQRAVDYFSYQCLRNIWIQRRHHRLPEWNMFCRWIESLPFAERLITAGFDNSRSD